MTIHHQSIKTPLGCHHLHGLKDHVFVNWLESNGEHVLRCCAFGRVFKRRLKRRPKHLDVALLVDVVAGRTL